MVSSFQIIESGANSISIEWALPYKIVYKYRKKKKTNNFKTDPGRRIEAFYGSSP